MNSFTLTIDLENSEWFKRLNVNESNNCGFRKREFDSEEELFDFLKQFFEFEEFGVYSYSKHLFTKGDCSSDFKFESVIETIKEIIKKASTCAIFNDDRIINLFNIKGKRLAILRIQNEITENRFKAKEALAKASNFFIIKNLLLQNEEKLHKDYSMPNQRYTWMEYLKFRDQLFEAIEEMIEFIKNHFSIVDIFKGTNNFSNFIKSDWEKYFEKIQEFENLRFVFSMNKLLNDSDALKLFASLIDISKLKMEYNDERMVG